jgi:phage baseplate assembly protein W
MARSDFITQTTKKLEYFSDFKDNFTKHPITNQLVKVTNEDAVAQSIRNLILTDMGEIPFTPSRGSNIRKSLFMPFGPFVIEDITKAVSDTIKHSEPRAQVLSIVVYESEAQNAVGINIVFSVINSVQPSSLNLILKRPR